SPGELEYIRQGQASATPVDGKENVGWSTLLRYRQAWGIIIGRTLLDPDWFGIYLVSKGIKPEDSVMAFWVPFMAGDLGNFFGGGLSSFWIKRGWPVGKARRAVLWIFGPS